MKKRGYVIVLMLVIVVIASCKHDPGPPIPNCKVSGVTYENYVKYIIEDKCLGCHTTNSIQPYQDTYSQVLIIANDGRLKNVLMGTQGYPRMPYQSDPLPDCMTENIVSWIDNGAPEM